VRPAQVEEASFKTSGNNADVAFGGVHQQMIMKSGGNTFHGSIEGDYENKNWQSNNVSDELAAQGFTITNPTIRYYDFNGDVGGYIFKNKLWFYGGASKQEIDQLQIGYVSGPNAAGCWTCPDAPPGQVIRILKQQYSKFSWQAAPSTKVIGTFVHAEKVTPFFGFGATTPEPTTRVQSQPTRTWKVETQSTPNTRTFIDAVFGFCCYWTNYTPQPGVAVAGNPASQEITNGMMTGPLGAIPGTIAERYQVRPTVSYIAGQHQLKFGADLNWERQDSTRPQEYPSGSYTLFFNRGVPTEIRTYNTPTIPIDRLYNQAAFATDTWSLRRVTRPGGVVAAAVWDFAGGLVYQRIFWDTAAALDPDAEQARSRHFSGPLLRAGELAAAFEAAGLCDVRPASLTVRMDYAEWSDYWEPIANAQGPVGDYVKGLPPDRLGSIAAAVRRAYLAGQPDGPRSMTATAWAARGVVP